MAKETAIFLHVPRTAGTTLHRIIDRQYSEHTDCWIGRDVRDGPEFIRFDAARRGQIRMLRGHFAYGLHKWIPGPAAYFTILRHPIERVISFYCFVRRNPAHYAHEALLAAGTTLYQYVKSQSTPVTSNFATRMISGSWADAPREPCTQVTLLRAKRNLAERFVLIGLTERFDETLLLLKRRFGWRNVFYRQLNATRGRPSLGAVPAATRALLCAHNQLDLELYGYAEDLFNAQIEAQGPGFRLAVRRFRFANRLAQPALCAFESARQVAVRAWIRQLAHPPPSD